MSEEDSRRRTGEMRISSSSPSRMRVRFSDRSRVICCACCGWTRRSSASNTCPQWQPQQQPRRAPSWWMPASYQRLALSRQQSATQKMPRPMACVTRHA